MDADHGRYLCPFSRCGRGCWTAWGIKRHVKGHVKRERAALSGSGDEVCSACNYDRHTCPGCGISVEHGTVACVGCKADVFGRNTAQP